MNTRTKKRLVGSIVLLLCLYFLIQFLPVIIALASNILYLGVMLPVIVLVVYGIVKLVQQRK
jgi:lipopolysaccharide export LptBFGC system permease protein LptF